MDDFQTVSMWVSLIVLAVVMIVDWIFGGCKDGDK